MKLGMFYANASISGEVLWADDANANVGCLYPPVGLMWTVGTVGRFSP